MSKVKLVFCKSFVDIPTHADTFSQEIDIKKPDGFSEIHLIGSRVDNSPYDGENPPGDTNAKIVSYRDFSDLQGKLLTYIDATFNDPEQRKAHKDLVKQIVWGWEKDLNERALQIVDSHTI